MELEEAIKKLNDLKEDVALFSTGWKNRLKDNEKQAIRTVLQAIVKLQKQCRELIKEKQELSSALLDSIPKKKIEDKKKEQEEKYNNSVNDVYKKTTEALIDFQRIVGAKEVLQELLEDK